MSRPRPLYVDHTARAGGAELCLADLAPHLPGAGAVLFEDGPLAGMLRGRGVEVTVWGEGLLDGVKRSAGPWRLAQAACGSLALARRLAGHVKATDADLLYANSLKAMIVSVIAGRLARRPVVWHLHDILSAEHFSRVNRTLCVRASNAGVALIIANSHATAAAYVAAGGKAPVTVVYNGLDADAIEAAPPAADPSPTGRPVVGLFARLSPWKGQHIFIEALDQLRRRGVDADGWIVGSAMFGENDYAAGLSQEIERAGLGDRVKRLGFRRDVAGLMKRCEVVVHASTAPEPFGRVIAEAMLAGRPVIAADAGGAAELIDHDRTGLLLPPGRADLLAEAIAGLLCDPVSRERLAAAGQCHARQHFTVARILPAWHAALEGVPRVVPREPVPVASR